MKLQEVSAQILTKQSDRASPNSVILTAIIIKTITYLKLAEPEKTTRLYISKLVKAIR